MQDFKTTEAYKTIAFDWGKVHNEISIIKRKPWKAAINETL
jgi:hypothetical protein